MINLYNRDRANLYLEKINDENPGLWKLRVDDKHNYVLEYIRVIGNVSDGKVVDIEAIDPSGGPFISIGDEFEGKYKVVGFKDCSTLIISENERNNNK